MQEKITSTQTIPVYFTFDHNYVLGARVAMYSMLEHASDAYFYKLYVLHADLKASTQRRLRKTIAPFKNASLEFIDVSRYDFGWENLTNKAYFSKEVFNKLIAADIFPQYDRIICSDVDVVFTGDISESYFLYEDEFFYYAGVRPILKNNSVDHYTENYSQEEIDIIRRGISGGYLLINLKHIRENRMQEKMIDFCKNNLARLYLPEQDCIDLCCFPHIKYLPFKYVVCMYFYRLDVAELEFNDDIEVFRENPDLARREFQQALDEAVQIHYVWHKKPWNSFGGTRWLLWMSYLRKTGGFAEYLRLQPYFFYKKMKKWNLKRFIRKMQQKMK